MEVVVTSRVPFLAVDALPTLKVGDQTFKLSRYADLRTMKELVFTIPAAEYQKLDKTRQVTVINGKVWELGRLSTASVKTQ